MAERDEKEVIRRAMRGDPQAIDMLFRKYHRFIKVLARRMQRSNALARRVSIDDHVQHGFLGMLRALKDFNPKRGVKFLSYASWWMRSFMMREMEDWEFGVYFPLTARRAAHRIHEARMELEREGLEPTLARLAERTGHTRSYIRDLEATSFGVASLSQLIPGTEMTLLDVLSDEAGVDAESHASIEVMKKRLHAAYESCAPDERALLYSLYFCDMTLDQAGSAIAPYRLDGKPISREGARQMELRVLKRLRRALAD